MPCSDMGLWIFGGPYALVIEIVCVVVCVFKKAKLFSIKWFNDGESPLS